MLNTKKLGAGSFAALLPSFRGAELIRIHSSRRITSPTRRQPALRSSMMSPPTKLLPSFARWMKRAMSLGML